VDNHVDIVLISNGKVDPTLEREWNLPGLSFVILGDLDGMIDDADFKGFWHIY
jgi:hypothetical protein